MKQHAFPISIHRLTVAIIPGGFFPSEIGIPRFVLASFFVKPFWLCGKDRRSTNPVNKKAADGQGVVSNLFGWMTRARHAGKQPVGRICLFLLGSLH